MKTLVYEIRAGRYECASFKDGEGDEVKFVFEQPIDANLTIGERVYLLSRGTVRVKISDICEGEVHPRLYAGGRMHKLEGFIVKKGEIIPLAPDADYIKRLGGICEELTRKIKSIESELELINKKIYQPLEF